MNTMLAQSTAEERLLLAQANVGKRLGVIFTVFAVSVTICVCSLVLLYGGFAPDAKTQLAFVAAFVLSLGMSAASVYAGLVTLWAAYLRERIERLRTDEDANLRSYQVREVVYRAVETVADNPEFESALQNKLRREPVAPLGKAVAQVINKFVTIEVIDEAMDKVDLPDELVIRP